MKKVILSLLFMGVFSSFLCADGFSPKARNDVIVCENGLDMLDYQLEMLRNAEKSIEISGNFSGGWVLREVLDTIDARMQERPELQCHFMTCSVVFGPGDAEYIKTMAEKHPDNFAYLITSSELELLPDVGSYENHIKTTIVDEKYFTIGGTSLDETMCAVGTFTPPRSHKGGILGNKLPAAYRDQDVVGRGSAAKDLRIYYYKLYAIWNDYNKRNKLTKDPEAFADNNDYFPISEKEKGKTYLIDQSPRLIADVSLRVMFCGPYQDYSAISAEYVKQIQNAEHSLDIGNLYFQPSESLMKVFKEASNRGVRINLTTNGVYSDSPFLHSIYAWNNRVHYVSLLYGRDFGLFDESKAKKSSVNNVTIYEYHVPEVTYHKKVMIVDDKRLIIGSYNLSAKSDHGDYEVVLIIDSARAAREALHVLVTDRAFSEKISPEQARHWYFDPVVDFVSRVQDKLKGFF